MKKAKWNDNLKILLNHKSVMIIELDHLCIHTKQKTTGIKK